MPGNVNFCFEGVSGESLLLLLDSRGLCASSGSACERTEEELRILKILTAEPLHTEQISLESGIPVPALLPILLRLELSGCVRQVTSGRFQKTTN